MSVIVGQAYDHLLKKQISQNADVGGWSFLQSLCEAKGIVRNKEVATEKPAYVHPTDQKLSVAKLSLEMCTESLGTESGSETGDEISSLALEATNIQMIPLTVNSREETHSKVRENSFLPPLKSVKGLQKMVKSYTEDGRLVVQAIRVCSPPRYFVSERCEGRLRLSLTECSLLSHDGDEEFEENESEFEARDEDEDKENGLEDDAEEEDEGIIGNNKFRRPRRRCNENGCEPKTMHKWKQQQFWVTT
ncbi:Protein FANTASTIC FOUR 1 [Hirschfeldia incana]|nr:Protein FANTASTIC FOUR 1 [Hirschfeldia incana]